MAGYEENREGTQSEESSQPEPEHEPGADERGEVTVVMSPLARIIGIFTEPARVMRSVAEKPNWFVPAIVLIVASLLLVVIAYDAIYEFSVDKVRQAIEDHVEAGNIPPDQADQIIENQTQLLGRLLYVNTVVGLFVFKLIIALLALLIGNVIFGGARKFGHYWSALWYAGIIGGLGMIVSAILMRATGDFEGVQLGLGILTKDDPGSIVHKIASAFDVFRIWEAWVMGIGVSLLAGTKRNNGIIAMLLVYLTIGILENVLLS